jgi:hypothetical protein
VDLEAGRLFDEGFGDAEQGGTACIVRIGPYRARRADVPFVRWRVTTRPSWPFLASQESSSITGEVIGVTDGRPLS